MRFDVVSLVLSITLVASTTGAVADEKKLKPPPLPSVLSNQLAMRPGATARGPMGRVPSLPPPIRTETTNGASDIARQASGGPAGPIAPAGDVAGNVVLAVDKTWDGQAWQLTLDWSGNAAPFTVSRSYGVGFEDPITLTMGGTDTTLTVAARTSVNLECFDVTDGTTVSRAVQGMGYDPYPRPGEATVVTTAQVYPPARWWRDEVTVSAEFLDLFATGNIQAMPYISVRAELAEPGPIPGFADQAQFAVPDDARSFWWAPQAHGRPTTDAEQLQELRPPDVGPYTNLRGISWAKQTGKIWVAADHLVQEVDVFLLHPTTETTITGVTKPYLSRVTQNGKLLYVGGTLGVATVYEIDVVTGVSTSYASTTDGTFTRSIRPRGIAVTSDGSACYIADASGGTGASRIVRIPRANTAPITDDYGGWPYWSFPDPAGMEVTQAGHLLVGSADNWIGVLPAAGYTYLYFHTSGTPHSLLLEHELSTDGVDRFFWGTEKCQAHAYNLNPLPDGHPPRYHGALITPSEAEPEFLAVGPIWDYLPDINQLVYPFPVILNREGQSHPFRNPWQVQDRLVSVTINGWSGVPLQLRLIDPMDLSTYTPLIDGWGPQPDIDAVLPYEHNDNKIWTEPSYTDFGLTTSSQGLAPARVLDVLPGSDHTATVYLKLPERYAGDNWQIEVSLKDAFGNLIPQRVAGLSAVYTGWKRVHVERDRMFRDGGLLSMYAAKGDTYIYLAKYERDSGFIRADTVSGGDIIAIFDTDHPVEGPHDVACAQIVNEHSDEVEIGLADVTTCSQPYHLKFDYDSSVSPLTDSWHFDRNSHSAGVGVYSDCDLSPNRINSEGSCYYRTDLRSVKEPFYYAFVEFRAPRDRMTALPYLPDEWMDDARSDTTVQKFSRLWFGHYQEAPEGDPPYDVPHNYFHAIGGSASPSSSAGFASTHWDFFFILVKDWEDDPVHNRQQIDRAIQTAVNHELAHLFEVNPDDCGGHDSNLAWCEEFGDCAANTRCLMQSDGGDPYDGVDRFCDEDLWKGCPETSNTTCFDDPRNWQKGDGAIRTVPDPR